MSGKKNKCQCTVSNFKIVRYDIGITWICAAVCIVLMEKVWEVHEISKESKITSCGVI